MTCMEVSKEREELIFVRKRLSDDLFSVLNMRPMPALALRINEACKNQQSDLNSIIELIQCEPGIAARILSIVNSPIYGYSREIDSIKQAVVVLGFRKLAEVTVSIASREVFSGSGRVFEEGLKLYEHSLACATTARLLAKEGTGMVDDGAAFMAGLLHDVGKLFLLDLVPETYSVLLETLQQANSVEHEFALFGTSHTDLGMEFARVNGLPLSIRSAIEQHHAQESTSKSSLASTVDIANSLVKIWNIGSSRCYYDNAMTPLTQKWLQETDEATVAAIRQTATEHFNIAKSMILG